MINLIFVKQKKQNLKSTIYFEKKKVILKKFQECLRSFRFIAMKDGNLYQLKSWIV